MSTKVTAADTGAVIATSTTNPASRASITEALTITELPDIITGNTTKKIDRDIALNMTTKTTITTTTSGKSSCIKGQITITKMTETTEVTKVGDRRVMTIQEAAEEVVEAEQVVEAEAGLIP